MYLFGVSFRASCYTRTVPEPMHIFTKTSILFESPCLDVCGGCMSESHYANIIRSALRRKNGSCFVCNVITTECTQQLGLLSSNYRVRIWFEFCNNIFKSIEMYPKAYARSEKLNRGAVFCSAKTVSWTNSTIQYTPVHYYCNIPPFLVGKTRRFAQ